MKKLFTMATIVALCFASCAKDEPTSGAKDEMGSVSVELNLETLVTETRADIACTTPAAEEFSLSINGLEGSYAADYDSIADFNNNNKLKAGDYTASVAAGDVTVEGYDKAAFAGEQAFTVAPRGEESVTITAYICNALVKVEVTEKFRKYFVGGHSLELKTAAGNTFDVSAQSEPIFIAPGNFFTINGTATKQANQSGGENITITLPEYKLDSPAARTLYTVKFDVENAGQATLTITTNDTVTTVEPIEQELNDNAQ